MRSLSRFSDKININKEFQAGKLKAQRMARDYRVSGVEGLELYHL
jgi:hypothetical protein